MTLTAEATERVGTGMHNMASGMPGVARRSFDCRAAYSNLRLPSIDPRRAR